MSHMLWSNEKKKLWEKTNEKKERTENVNRVVACVVNVLDNDEKEVGRMDVVLAKFHQDLVSL